MDFRATGIIKKLGNSLEKGISSRFLPWEGTKNGKKGKKGLKNKKQTTVAPNSPQKLLGRPLGTRPSNKYGNKAFFRGIQPCPNGRLSPQSRALSAGQQLSSYTS